MRKIYLLFLIVVIGACTGPSTPTQPMDRIEPQWRSLFNGATLDGWVMKINGYELNDNYANTFRVEDSILKISYDDYERYDQRYGALYFDESFDNYRLKVEYRFVGDTAHAAPNWGFRDSGIQYHGQSPQSVAKGQYFPVCLEFNLHGGDGENERPNGQICTIGTKVIFEGELNRDFCTMPSISRTFHGDQWVTAEIEVKDDSISHWLNGEKVLAFSSPQYDPDHDLGKTFIQGDTVAITSGYISLQSNSHPIQFRKIEILEY
ncbi:MAG: DUF1080 domain-containing protein [Bacteroidota bacterium]